MPAFSFEKLSPPVRREASPVVTAAPKRHRGIIVQMLDRLTEARLRRSNKGIPVSAHVAPAVAHRK